MNRQKLSPTRIIVGTAMLILLIIIIAIQIKDAMAPVTLDAKYLSEDVLRDFTVSEIIGKVEIKDGLVVCLCTTPDGQLATLYLEKKIRGYQYKERHSIAPAMLTPDQSHYVKFTPFLPAHNDVDVYYAVFVNPQNDSLMVNQKSVPIQKIDVQFNDQDGSLGFWCTDLPKGSTIQLD